MKICQDCGASLGKDAYKCRCGWRLEVSSRKHIDCAFAPHCTAPAVIRERSANLCSEHYQQVSEQQITDRWVEAGRPGAAESIARMKAIMRRPKPTPREHCERILAMKNPPREAKEMALKLLRRTEVNREPGCDDEEVHELAR